MRRYILLLVFIAVSTLVSAQKATLVKSPNDLPETDDRLKIFLGGSIDMGNAEDWQATVEQQLFDVPVILLNPRRDDWNPDWEPVSTNPNFKTQVIWELSALEQADVIIMYFAPHSKSPISLLELGLYAKTNKLMVICPEGYWRKGNVDILCEVYGIKMFDTIDAVIEEIKRHLP